MEGILCEQARHTVTGLLRLARTGVGCPVLGFLPNDVYGSAFAFVFYVMRAHFAIESTGSRRMNEPGRTDATRSH